MAVASVGALEEKIRRARALAPHNLAAHAWLLHRDDRDRRLTLASHHQVIAAVLQDRGRYPYVVIVCPPGAGKSTYGSIVYPAWRLGATGGRVRMGLISNTATQAEGFARAVQQTLESDSYAEAYPEAQRDPTRRWTHREMYMTGTPQGANPALMAMGMDGPILGKRFDEIIIDDPTTWAQARSETIMEEQRSKLLNTIIQRFPAGARPPHGDGSTRMVVLMTRYGERDLLPSFRQLGFHVVVLPALGYWDRLITCPECGRREVGHRPCQHDERAYEIEWGRAALWPEKEPRAQLEAMREHDELIFELVYQANPSVLSGDVFDPGWFRYGEPPPRFEMVAMGIDTAGGRDRKRGDYTAIVAVGMKGEQAWVLDAWRDRVPAPEQEQRVATKFEELRQRGLTPELVAIEDANEGRALYDYLLRNTRLPVKAVAPQGDKEFRAISLSNAYRAGRVWHPEGQRWTRALEAELEAFPEGAHDDLCFPGDTLVMSAHGPCSIAEIRPGDQVLGESGWVTVEDTRCTGRQEVYCRWGMRATAGHPVWTDQGWTRFLDVAHDARLRVCDALLTAAIERRKRGASVCGATSASGDSHGASSPRRDPSDAPSRDARLAARSSGDSAVAITRVGSAMATPWSSMRRSAAQWRSRLSSSAGSSFADTQTRRRHLTAATTSQADSGSSVAFRRSTKRSGRRTTARSPRAMTSTIATGTTRTTASRTLSALPRPTTPSSMLTSAPHMGARRSSLRTSLRSARSLLNGIAPTPDALGIESTLGDKASGGRVPVFNLKTTDGTYFADGVLVHNCDALVLAYSQTAPGAGGPRLRVLS